jgi:hypothetical protein
LKATRTKLLFLILIPFVTFSQNVSSEILEMLVNDNQSKGEEFVPGLIYNGAYLIEDNYYYEYKVIDCEYQQKASKNPEFLENASNASIYNLNENPESKELYKTIGKNSYNIVFKYSCKDGSNEFKLSYEFANGMFNPIFEIDELIKSNIQNVHFVFNDDFIKISKDYWKKELYKEDFSEILDQTDVLNLKLQELEAITNDLFTNDNILFYVKNDFGALITIEKSGISFEFARTHKEELCKQQKKIFLDIGEIINFNCEIDKINGRNYFITEAKTKIVLELNYTPFEWSNQYWTDVRGDVYHITINSTSGLKINDVLIAVK